MKKSVRILAIRTGDVDDSEDVRWKIILDGVVDEHHYLVAQDYFGYTQAVNENDNRSYDWPFILRYAKGQPVFDSGPMSGYKAELTNLYSKTIRINEIFTRGSGDDTSTYRIVKVELLG